MRLNEVRYPDGTPVDGYGPGFFRISNEVIEGAVLILPSGVSRWGGLDDLEAIGAARDAIDVLFVGTGPEMAHIPDGMRDLTENAGIAVEVMGTPAACRTYNVLLSEGRRVGLAALPIS